MGKNIEYLPVVIELLEERNFLYIYSPQLLNIKDSVFKGVAFQTMLALSYEMKMLRFEYDPNDGEVRASIELPIEDGNLTLKQFQCCLMGLVYMIDELAMPRLKAVLATGEDPGAKGQVEEVAQLLADSNSEMLEILEQAIAKLAEGIALRKQQDS